MAEFQPLLDAGRSRRRGMGRQAKRSPAGMVGVRKWIAAASVKVVTSQLHPKIDFHQLCCRVRAFRGREKNSRFILCTGISIIATTKI